MRDDSNAAAAVLVGAGLAIGVEGYRYVLDEQRRADEREETNAHWKRQGLDETRRLLYMALSVSDAARHGSAELAGSIANSLAHHSQRLTEKEARSLAKAIATGAPVTDRTVTDRIEWQIESITTELEDAAPADP